MKFIFVGRAAGSEAEAKHSKNVDCLKPVAGASPAPTYQVKV